MNFEKYVQSKFYGFFDKFYVILFANLVFTLLTIAGLGVFSFMPSLIALFIMINSACIQNEKVSIFKMFVIFKNEYLKSQKVFIIFLLFGLLFAYNTNYFYYCFNDPNITNIYYALGFYITIFIDLFYLICFIHSILVYIFFPHLSVKKTIKYSAVFALSFIKQNILLMLLIIISIFITILFIYLLPFFLVGVFSYLVLTIFNKPVMELVKDNPYLLVSKY